MFYETLVGSPVLATSLHAHILTQLLAAVARTTDLLAALAKGRGGEEGGQGRDGRDWNSILSQNEKYKASWLYHICANSPKSVAVVSVCCVR